LAETNVNITVEIYVAGVVAAGPCIVYNNSKLCRVALGIASHIREQSVRHQAWSL
jgi:hypothetical protein